MTTKTMQTLTGSMIAAIALAATPTLAAPPIRYESDTGHSVLVEGTSNVHDWTGTTDQVRGWIEVPGDWIEQDGELRLEPALQADDATPRIQVQIPTGTLEGNRRGLASNMHSALKVSTHPNVTFALVSLESATAADNGTAWTAIGDLEIAGHSRLLALDLTITPLTNDRLRIDVAKDLLMTDFGIDPPRAMMGMARAADEVQVQISWIVKRQTPQPTVPSDAGSSEHQQAMSSVLDGYEQARAALAAGDQAQAQKALDELAQVVEALAVLDAEALDEAVRSDWSISIARLQGTAANAAEAQSLSASRASFAVLSQAVVGVLNIVGHDQDDAPLAYRHAGQSGLAGSMWLQTNGAARSPYAASNATPQIAAVYVGQANPASE
ncbi:YceI family protein [Phycisphaerales bacterium AB-hyl4]|uniref:YceI family protein n=1 Tax=Natronomicrosphaera hydrolytica TaxID=3242702 RepID=A0ABV4U6L5_9BACT